MSPEQREGRPATPQSDLFSVGVMLLEMLTGAVPGELPGASAPLATFHRHLDGRHDAVVARLVARNPTERPADAFEAARMLTELSWPIDPDSTHFTARRPETAPVPVAPTRIVPLEGSGFGGFSCVHDAWLDRTVARTASNARALSLAGAFARAAHQALQLVLRVDREDGTVWLGVPRGRLLDRPLEVRERATLAEALAALHAEGGVHGSVDPGSIVVGRDGPVLLFPTTDNPAATPDLDRVALGRM
jgi:serine/threonine-protein kinase